MNNPQPARMGAVRSRLVLASPEMFGKGGKAPAEFHKLYTAHGYKHTVSRRDYTGEDPAHYYKHKDGHHIRHYHDTAEKNPHQIFHYHKGHQNPNSEHSTYNSISKHLSKFHGGKK